VGPLVSHGLLLGEAGAQCTVVGRFVFARLGFDYWVGSSKSLVPDDHVPERYCTGRARRPARLPANCQKNDACKRVANRVKRFL